MKIHSILLVMCLFIAGCTEKEAPPSLSGSDLAKALDIEFWKIQPPAQINDGDNLVLYFVDHEGNEIISACNLTIHPNETESVNIALIPQKSQPSGAIMGYEISMFNSKSIRRTIINNPLNKNQLTRSSRTHLPEYNVGDILKVYGGEKSPIFTTGKIREFQIGITTKIVNHN